MAAGTIDTGAGMWGSSGWLFRFVLEQVDRVVTSPEGREELDAARAIDVLDVTEFPEPEQTRVRAALGEPLITAFRQDLQSGYDPGPAIELLRQLGAMAAGTPATSDPGSSVAGD